MAAATIMPSPPSLTCRYCFDPEREHAAFHRSTLTKAKARNCPLCTTVTAAVELFCATEGHPIPRSVLIWDAANGRITLDSSSDGFLELQLCVRQEDRDALPQGLSWPRSDSPSPYTGSDQALRWACEQLRECKSGHPLCSAITTARFPPRMVHIQHGSTHLGNAGSLEIKLVKYDPSLGDYACLSHCWGPNGPLKTTKATQTAFETSIPWTLIPKSFQESITFLAGAGFSYVWIDSLCIVQDDDDDKKLQIPLMGDIYQGASLTAAVTKSSEPSQGCFAHLPPRFRGYALQPPTNSTFPLITVREVFPHDHSQHGYKTPDRDQVPLLFRGWVLQERLLSRRILHFTSEELGWECLTSHSCECDRDPNGRPGFKEGVSLAINTGPPAELYPQWRSLVEQYTTMGLTFPGDRLPAIAGLSGKFRDRLGDAYISGLWAENVHESLSWIVLDPPERSQASSQPAAPSWSWASSTVAVRHPYKERWTDGTQVERAQVTLDEVSSHMGIEKFTTATHFVRITAPSVSDLKIVQLDDFHARDPYSENPYRGKKYGVVTGSSFPRVIFPDFHLFDGPRGISLDEEFHLARLVRFPSVVPEGRDTGRRTDEWWFIILRCINASQGVFERVGWVDIALPGAQWVPELGLREFKMV